MTVALIDNSTQTTVAEYDAPPGLLSLPNGEQVSGAAVGWTSQDGGYSLVDVALTPLQTAQAQVVAAIAAGLAVTSTSTPALNGTYAVDAVAQANIQAVVTGLAAGLGLPGGGTTFAYFDTSGAAHVFTAARFEALAVAIRDYVYALDLYESGQSALPSPSVTIA